MEINCDERKKEEKGKKDRKNRKKKIFLLYLRKFLFN